jgi:hypothetical protein
VRMPRGLLLAEVIITEFIRCSFIFFVAVRTVSDSATVAALCHHNYTTITLSMQFSNLYIDFGL